MDRFNSVTSYERGDDYPCLRISNDAADAEIALHGAHVTQFSPEGQSGLLYLSKHALYEEGKAIRGGIPICWPWFGDHTEDPSLPAHGFVRNRFWELLDIEEPDNHTTRVRLTTRDDEHSRSLWPHRFRLTLTVTVGDTLRVELEAENTDQNPWTCGGALHSYLAVGDIKKTFIQNISGLDYLDKPDGFARKHQSGDVTFEQEVDRVYLGHGGNAAIVDKAQDRVINVDKAGSKVTVIWNPWSEIARNMKDMGDEDYRKFVCVEPTNAFNDLITLKPGEKHRLSTTIGLS